MATITDGLFGVVVLTGVGLCALGFYTSRKWEQVGTNFLVATVVLFGLGAIVSGGIGLVVGIDIPDDFAQPLWAGSSYMFWATTAVPWFLFVLTYTGWYTKIGWRTVVTLYAPIVFGLLAGFMFLRTSAPGLIDILLSIALIYAMALIFVGAFLLVQATRSHVHLSTIHGVSLSLLPILLALSLNSIPMLQQISPTVALAQYTIVFVVGAVGFLVALLWRPLLAWTPAVRRIGDQATIEETDDLVFVVNGDDQIVKCNEAAADVLPHDHEKILGRHLTDILGYDSDSLDGRETITLETSTGQQRYDPGVSKIIHGTGTSLGTVLGLRDVTDRELREQRLSVLNRVLRHNLRNKVDVGKSFVEALDAELEHSTDHVEGIENVFEDIAELGYTTRQIDQFISDSTEPTEVDLCNIIETTLNSLDTTGVIVSVNCPEDARVSTRRQALEVALDSAVDNAITYATAAVEIGVAEHPEGYKLSITDDGPGIPESELDSLKAGIESPLQHGTGLGLWQLKWSVTAMSGELAFETGQGTTVSFVVPDQTDGTATE